LRNYLVGGGFDACKVGEVDLDEGDGDVRRGLSGAGYGCLGGLDLAAREEDVGGFVADQLDDGASSDASSTWTAPCQPGGPSKETKNLPTERLWIAGLTTSNEDDLARQVWHVLLGIKLRHLDRTQPK
jgi:hypothetical protein